VAVADFWCNRFQVFGSIFLCQIYTIKTGVSFRHLLRHRNSVLASVISTLNGVCSRVKTFKCENDTSFILSSVENDILTGLD
jgi:hypothetical protein